MATALTYLKDLLRTIPLVMFRHGGSTMPHGLHIWKMYADYMWSVDPDTYVILEHFADNSEEEVLADYGMMLWGNSNYQYWEAAMGFDSDISWIDYEQRGWTYPHQLVIWKVMMKKE